MTQTTVDPAVTDPPDEGATDTRPPQVTIAGVRAKLKRKKFLKGVTAQVGADEPSSFEIQLLGPAKKPHGRPKAPDVVLATASLPLGAEPPPVTLKPTKSLVRKARRLTARSRSRRSMRPATGPPRAPDIRVKR